MRPLWRQLVHRWVRLWRQALPLGMMLLALLAVLLLKGCGGGGGVQSLLPTAQSPNPTSQPTNSPATTPIESTPGIPGQSPTLPPTSGIPSQNPTPIGANPSTPGIPNQTGSAAPSD